MRDRGKQRAAGRDRYARTRKKEPTLPAVSRVTGGMLHARAMQHLFGGIPTCPKSALAIDRARGRGTAGPRAQTNERGWPVGMPPEGGDGEDAPEDGARMEAWAAACFGGTK
jgi:hypothetical protein